jgi:hypothetical protein
MINESLFQHFVQLRLANQNKIVSIGRLEGVSMNIDGVHSVEYFEVIEIVDDNQPYPTLIGLEWDSSDHQLEKERDDF